ncbi:DUF3039 domain-containing protein [Arthrobacter koreensis]|uniref:DUF3039 domain-containing protein n=1 Tax=Arthrobacter koreensis TaxID=199136 RepID=UPI003B846D4F
MTSAAALPQVASQAVEPTAFHYLKKSAITRSLALGTKGTALCGYTDSFGVALGRVSNSVTKRTVCPLCRSLFNLLGGPK